MRVNGAVTQNWIYKDGLAPVAETDGGTNIISFFVYGTSALSPDYMVREGATYRLIRDFQGSVRLVVNAATGDIAQRLDYDSFGNVLRDTNLGFQPFGFKSGLYDPDTGLVHFGARWYDPETGRWIAKDPILLEGGLNLYAFCGNDPVNFSDPWGLCENFSDFFDVSKEPGIGDMSFDYIAMGAGTLIKLPSLGGLLERWFGNGAAKSAEQLEFGFVNGFGQNSGLVIGRGRALEAPGALDVGEYKLGWFSVQEASGMEAEWAVNQAKLLEVMKLKLPIRDVSPLSDVGGFYLNRERGLLQSSGWCYQNGYWIPPKP